MISRLSLYFALPRILQIPLLNAYGLWQARQRFGGEFHEILQEIEKTQWWSPEDLQALQNERLSALIDYAYKEVPYYNRLLNERGLKPSDIRSVEDLSNLPFLTKEIINEHFDDLVAQGYPENLRLLHHTSGTTGVKLKGFYLPKRLRWSVNYAFLYRFYHWAGFEVGDKRVTIGGRYFTNRPPFWMFNKAENQLLLSAHHLNSFTVDGYLEQIRKFAPRAIQGHPSAIAYLAKRLEEKNETIKVHAVLTTGEQLFPDQRVLIEERFECQVFDAWGHGESAGMAAECDKHEGYHVAVEYGVVEIIPIEGVSEHLGEIVVTSLYNYAMPFIRYRTGDLGVWAQKPCSCGRGLPLLKKIIGRIDDMLLTPEGQVVLPLSLRTRLAKIPFLMQYQIIQEDVDTYRIYVVSKEALRTHEKNAILEVLFEYLGESARILIEMVPQIPKTKGAKQRLIINSYLRRARSSGTGQ